MKRNKFIALIFAVMLVFTLVACKDNKVDNLLPELTNLTQSEIVEKFNEQGLIVTLDFQEFFVKNSTDQLFVSYGEGFSVGDEVNSGDVITINVSTPKLRLPNLTGLTSNEVKDAFANLGVDSADIRIEFDINRQVIPGTFIAYKDHQVGDSYSFDKRLSVLIDISKSLPNIQGLNIFQINKFFKELSLESAVKYNYIVDNTKEMDSFHSYETFKPGDSVSTNDEIIINIVSNDNINTNETGLFISKYIDTGSNGQGIELFNSTDSDINLVDYYIAILTNGSLVSNYNISLTGTLAPNTTYVIVKEGSSAELVAKADLVSKDLQFDGNDTIQLRKVLNDTYIDIIYNVGNTAATMDEEVFIRHSNITSGRRDFVQNEWFGYIPSFIDPIGTHPYDEPFGPEFELIADKTFQQYGMTKVKLLRIADGDTVYLESLDPRDTTSYDNDTRIRFLLVDTPETTKPDVKGEPYAQVATQFTTKLLNASTTIYLQSDRGAGLTETYGRHLGLIWFELESDVTFTNIAATGSVTVEAGWHLLNYELLKHGLGSKSSAKTDKYKESPIYSNRYVYQWANEADLYAKENKLGLYSGVNRT